MSTDVILNGIETDGDTAQADISPYTPRHNGKVERSYRKDGERFYAGSKFYNLEDYNK